MVSALPAGFQAVANRRAAVLTLLLLSLASLTQPGVAGEGVGPVRPGDTLWEIAGRAYPGTGIDRNQALVALLRANPNAIAPACNVNGTLRVGVRLSLPPPAAAAALDPRQARQIIAGQAQDWAAHRRHGTPLACPPESSDAAPPVAGVPATTTDEPSGTLTARAAATPAAPRPEPAPAAAPIAMERASPDRPRQGSPSPPPGQGAETGTAAYPDLATPLSPGRSASVALLIPLLLALTAVALLRWEQWTVPPRAYLTPRFTVAALARLPGRGRDWLRRGRPAGYGLLLLAALVGVLGALATVLFRAGIDALERLFTGRVGSLAAVALDLPAWQRLLLPTLGGLIAGLILQEIGSRLRGRTDTDYMRAVALGDGWISVRHSLVNAASSLFTVSSGGSLGREGAMVQLAAMVGSTLGRISRLPHDRRRLLVAAGAAAGLAAAYNAPLAATIFVAEIVLGSIALEQIGPLIVAAVIASTTVHDLLGYAPVYQIPQFHLVSDWELGLYLLLGLIAGQVAPFFLTLLGRARHLFARLPVSLAGRLALGGLVVGVISVYEPQVWGKGHGVVDAVLRDPWAWHALATVLLLKMLATAATLGSGGIGGAFTPTMFVGAMLGSLFGTLVHDTWPLASGPASAYGVVGMAALLAAATHAPLMSILMVLEMTLDYQIVLPLMLAVVIAHYSARGYGGVRPMYAESLLPREPTDTVHSDAVPPSPQPASPANR
jgi:FimV-like protein